MNEMFRNVLATKRACNKTCLQQNVLATKRACNKTCLQQNE